MRRIAVTFAALAAALALTIPAAQASVLARGVVNYRFAAYNDFTRSRVDCREAVLIFDRDTTTPADDLVGARGRCEIIYGAKRLVGYSTRLYEVKAPLLDGTCPTGYGTVEGHRCVKAIFANEIDRYSGEGTPSDVLLHSIRPKAIDPAVCTIAARTGVGIRWYNNVLGSRAMWSANVPNPRAAATCPS